MSRRAADLFKCFVVALCLVGALTLVGEASQGEHKNLALLDATTLNTPEPRRESDMFDSLARLHENEGASFTCSVSR